MQLSIYLDLRNPPQWHRPSDVQFARSLELIAEADRLGAGRVWLSEHHFFEDGYLPQPLTFAAAVAARTTRIRIGTAVFLVALRPAIQSAEEAAVVDILSGGRLDLGVGVGYRVPEFTAYGQDIRNRYPLVEARVGEIRELWKDRVTPRPIQPEIPFWGGFFGPRGAQLAGRLNMGLLSMDPVTVGHYLDGLEAGGYPADSARICANLRVVVSNDPDRDWPRIRPHLEYMWDRYNAYGAEGTGKPAPPLIDADEWRRWGDDGRPPRFQVLTPEQTVEFIHTVTAGLPVEELYSWSSIAGMPDDIVEEHQRLLLTQVAPAVEDLDPRTLAPARIPISGPSRLV